jgi:hypothetical protein
MCQYRPDGVAECRTFTDRLRRVPHGSHIPTELVATYGIAGSAACRAVTRLRDQNLIESVATQGSYVPCGEHALSRTNLEIPVQRVVG